MTKAADADDRDQIACLGWCIAQRSERGQPRDASSAADAAPRRIILTGHLPSYLYEHGAVDTRIPLEELRQHADVTSRVESAEQ
jgi:hypothetical protein